MFSFYDHLFGRRLFRLCRRRQIGRRAANLDRLNGQGRLLVRSSGTEPVIRVMGEGDDRILVEEVVDHIVTALGHAAAA